MWERGAISDMLVAITAPLLFTMRPPSLVLLTPTVDGPEIADRTSLVSSRLLGETILVMIMVIR